MTPDGIAMKSGPQKIKPWVSCGEPDPNDPDAECLDKKGHAGDHGYDRWPHGFGKGPYEEVRWPQTP